MPSSFFQPGCAFQIAPATPHLPFLPFHLPTSTCCFSAFVQLRRKNSWMATQYQSSSKGSSLKLALARTSPALDPEATPFVPPLKSTSRPIQPLPPSAYRAAHRPAPPIYCSFFNSEGGCKYGDGCRFVHERPGEVGVQNALPGAWERRMRREREGLERRRDGEAPGEGREDTSEAHGAQAIRELLEGMKRMRVAGREADVGGGDRQGLCRRPERQCPYWQRGG